ncbi:STAS domain-containing protein [Actinomadura sp. ATCC 31491]|uniref:STAS domain-containing protein n=1 Tax=Actinomadura luzonensis TaxID=2805427 RepID=A0ABT0FNF0_9ACTN|nr:STAS domain-containing protein [Actinomadura luzonensis]MCK2213878.1 STAS domain-containing protein [Actinomadura luzonensis]
MTRSGLRIETTRHLHCTVIRASGRLDHAGRVRFSACVTAVWDWSPGPVLVFDLADLDFYDSSVIGVLAMAMQRMEEQQDGTGEAGGRIILVRPSGHLLSVLRLTDLLSRVDVRDSVEETVAELMLQRGPHGSAPSRAGPPVTGPTARTPPEDATRPH